MGNHMEGTLRVLSLDEDTSVAMAYMWSTLLPTIGDIESGVFHHDSIAYQVVRRDPKPYEHEGEVMDGGRIWWRRVR